MAETRDLATSELPSYRLQELLDDPIMALLLRADGLSETDVRDAVADALVALSDRAGDGSDRSAAA